MASGERPIGTQNTITQSRFEATDDIDDRLRLGMGLDELVGLR
jgi:hypothetical protein